MAWRREAAWRRGAEALLGTPGGLPAIEVSLRAGQVRCRVLARAGSAAATASATVTTQAFAVRGAGANAAASALPFRDASIAWAAAWFVGDASPTPVRRALLAELARVLAPAGTLVIVDHNRPRRRLAALAATILPPRPPGATPIAAWRRLAYPAAREAQAAGLVVDRLRLAAGERVQVIFTRRPPHG